MPTQNEIKTKYRILYKYGTVSDEDLPYLKIAEEKELQHCDEKDEQYIYPIWFTVLCSLAIVLGIVCQFFKNYG